MVNAQKRVIRTITLDHTLPLFKGVNILHFENIYQYHLAIFMYNFNSNKIITDLFNSYFIKNLSITIPDKKTFYTFPSAFLSYLNPHLNIKE